MKKKNLHQLTGTCCRVFHNRVFFTPILSSRPRRLLQRSSRGWNGWSSQYFLLATLFHKFPAAKNLTILSARYTSCPFFGLIDFHTKEWSNATEIQAITQYINTILISVSHSGLPFLSWSCRLAARAEKFCSHLLRTMLSHFLWMSNIFINLTKSTAKLKSTLAFIT